jgi:hypothetical protein
VEKILGQVLHFRDSQMWLTVIHFRRGKSPEDTAGQVRAALRYWSEALATCERLEEESQKLCAPSLHGSSLVTSCVA